MNDSTLPSDLLRSVNQSRDKGASSWLTAVPLVDQGLVLNRQEFRDSLRLRYNMPLSDLPSVFGVRSIPSTMPCHAKGEVSWRRDTMVFATYLPHLLVRFAPTLKSNHNYDLSIMSRIQPTNRGNKPRGKTELEGRGVLVSWSYSIFLMSE